MELTCRFIDVDKTQRTTHGYADLIPREGPTGRWFIPKSPLTAAEQQWQMVEHGKLVEVPLVPYLVNPDMLHMFGFATQLGVLARNSFEGAVIRAIRLSVGGPVTVEDRGSGQKWRVYLGVAVFID